VLAILKEWSTVRSKPLTSIALDAANPANYSTALDGRGKCAGAVNHGVAVPQALAAARGRGKADAAELR